MQTTDEQANKAQNPRQALLGALPRLLLLARPEAPRLFTGLFFLTLGSAMSLAFPQAIRIIIDEALSAEGVKNIDLAAIILMAAFVVQGISVGIRHYIFTVVGERVVARLRAQLYERVIAQEIGFFDARRTGELTNRLSSDTTVLQNTVSVNISMALRSAAAVLGGTALLFYTSPILTAVMLSVVPPISIGAAIYGRRLRKISRDVQDRLAEAGEVAEETISAIRTVRAFAREAEEAARYNGAVMVAFEAARRRVRTVALFTGGVSIAGYGAIALVFWYGGHLVADGSITVGDLTSFVLYTLIVAFSLGALGGLWADFMRAAGAAERVFELVDREPAIANSGGARLDAVTGAVALETVRFAYPARRDVAVLQGVSLAVAPGEVVALVGPSGGGKSTIANLIARFYDPLEGRVTLDGRDLRDLDSTWLRQQIGSVAQEPILMSTTVGENIRYGRPHASTAEVQECARAANALDFINGFPEGLDTLVGERGVQLSGGQKQRVAIARALLKDPRVLILDEATSALDAESEFLVREALERLMKGRTTLIIAHRLSTVKGADRAVVVEDGHIVEVGPHSELMQRHDSLYRKLVERQLLDS